MSAIAIHGPDCTCIRCASDLLDANLVAATEARTVNAIARYLHHVADGSVSRESAHLLRSCAAAIQRLDWKGWSS